MKLAMKILCSIGFVVALYLGAGVLFSKAHGQDKTFPVGVPVETQALFCGKMEHSQVIADAKGETSPEIEVLVATGACAQLRGIAIYVRKVYEKDGWAVWELTSGNIPKFYEATDWKEVKPPPKGQTST